MRSLDHSPQLMRMRLCRELVLYTTRGPHRIFTSGGSQVVLHVTPSIFTTGTHMYLSRINFWLNFESRILAYTDVMSQRNSSVRRWPDVTSTLSNYRSLLIWDKQCTDGRQKIGRKPSLWYDSSTYTKGREQEVDSKRRLLE